MSTIAPASWRCARPARVGQTFEEVGRVVTVVAVVVVGGIAAAGAYAGYQAFGPWGLLGGVALPAAVYVWASPAWKDAPS